MLAKTRGENPGPACAESPSMNLGRVLLVGAKVAVLLADCDDPWAIRCGIPGRKATVIQARALAERLQPVASTTHRCPSTSDLRKTDVDAWNQPFLISCEQGDQIMVVVRSKGPDGVFGTADDLIRSAETAADAGAPIERQPDAGHGPDQAAVDGSSPSDDKRLSSSGAARTRLAIRSAQGDDQTPRRPSGAADRSRQG